MRQKVDPWVLDTLFSADRHGVSRHAPRTERPARRDAPCPPRSKRDAFVLDALRATAERSRRPCSPCSPRAASEHRPFWVANMIWVRGDLAPRRRAGGARRRVPHLREPHGPLRRAGRIDARPADPPRPTPSSGASRRSTRPRSWAPGFTGQGIVVGGQDTGYDWTIRRSSDQYRGWNGAPPTTTTTGTTPSTPAAAPAAPTPPRPATTTATARTPWAPWSATTAAATRSAWRPARTGSAAATWTRASARRPPTPSASSGSSRRPTSTTQNPDPAKAPHVINNSWGCPPSEGCTIPDVLRHGRREHARGRHRRRGLGRQRRLRLLHRRRPGRDLRRVVLASARPHADDTDRELQQPRPGHRRRQQPPQARRLGARHRASARASRAAATASAAPAWPGRTWPAGRAAALRASLAQGSRRVEAILEATAAPDVRRRPAAASRAPRSRTTPTATGGWTRPGRSPQAQRRSRASRRRTRRIPRSRERPSPTR